MLDIFPPHEPFRKRNLFKDNFKNIGTLFFRKERTFSGTWEGFQKHRNPFRNPSELLTPKSSQLGTFSTLKNPGIFLGAQEPFQGPRKHIFKNTCTFRGRKDRRKETFQEHFWEPQNIFRDPEGFSKILIKNLNHL